LFDNFNYMFFIEINNLEEMFLSRINIQSYRYTDYGKRDELLQFQTIVIAGFVFEF